MPPRSKTPAPVQEPIKCPYLTTKQAAEFLGSTPHSLQMLRTRGDGPAFLKLGPRRVAYLMKDLEAWAEAGRRTSTSDPGFGRRR
jgi:predicted DNA-binding transcriptional regulator AlpA